MLFDRVQRKDPVSRFMALSSVLGFQRKGADGPWRSLVSEASNICHFPPCRLPLQQQSLCAMKYRLRPSEKCFLVHVECPLVFILVPIFFSLYQMKTTYMSESGKVEKTKNTKYRLKRK